MDPSKYIQKDKPANLKPFDLALHGVLVEDYMDGVRKRNIIGAQTPQLMELMTLDYELEATRLLLKPEEPEVVHFILKCEIAGTRHSVLRQQIAGVDEDGVLWLAEYGGYITAPNEVEIKMEAEKILHGLLGGSVSDLLQRMFGGGGSPPSDDDPAERWKQS